MKVVFFGTPEFVIPILAALHKEFNSGRTRELIAVVTQPGKEVGRKKYLQRSAVDEWAYDHKIPVITDLNDIPSADLGVTAAYGSIIPQVVINNFKHGILNIHPSLLPELRGASPIQSAIALGKHETGISIIKMDEQMDHGPVVIQVLEEILETDTNESLRTKLFERSVPLLMDLLAPYIAGKIKLKEQNHEKATFTKSINREDGFIPGEIILATIEGKESKASLEPKFIKDAVIKANAVSVYNFYRALSPWPGIWTYVFIGNKKKRLIIKELHLDTNKIVIDLVQLEGKNPVPWKQFNEGYKGYKFNE